MIRFLYIDNKIIFLFLKCNLMEFPLLMYYKLKYKSIALKSI